jgi:hypothetical protein
MDWQLDHREHPFYDNHPQVFFVSNDCASTLFTEAPIFVKTQR